MTTIDATTEATKYGIYMLVPDGHGDFETALAESTIYGTREEAIDAMNRCPDHRSLSVHGHPCNSRPAFAVAAALDPPPRFDWKTIS